MKWFQVLGITIVIILMVGFQWSRLSKGQRKEKAAFLVLTGIGYVLAVLLLFFPQLPGPTQLVEWIFGPLGKLLEK